MLRLINRVFIAIILLLAFAGIMLSIATLFIPALIGEEALEMQKRPDLSLEGVPARLSPADSPAEVNVTISTPPLKQGDLLSLEVYGNGRKLAGTDCLKGLEEQEYAGKARLNCTARFPYDYLASGTYDVTASFTRDGAEYGAGPVSAAVAWSAYEANFWNFSWSLAAIIGMIYLVILLPVTLGVAYVALGMRHGQASEGEYSLSSLILLNGKTLGQKFQSFLLSPYFWAFECIGIVAIIAYMAVSARIWASAPAVVAFIFSGLLSFIVPYLWCIAWWYVDYREREPLRIIVTFFLWGMLAALMAIGLNTIAGVLLGLVGLGFLLSFFLAPPLEEFYKGAGLGLLSGHHEYNSIEDGFVFGFVIGMGFSFIEDWIYLLQNPMGSNMVGWLLVFFLRSILFSANHGFFTALTGGIIGWLIELKFRAPALGLLLGIPIAAFFHAMHNSGETIIALLGAGGALLYCCFLIPFFDYGGFIILVLFFIRAVLRKKGGSGQ